jgi:hypothetical protein
MASFWFVSDVARIGADVPALQPAELLCGRDGWD